MAQDTRQQEIDAGHEPLRSDVIDDPPGVGLEEDQQAQPDHGRRHDDGEVEQSVDEGSAWQTKSGERVGRRNRHHHREQRSQRRHQHTELDREVILRVPQAVYEQLPAALPHRLLRLRQVQDVARQHQRNTRQEDDQDPADHNREKPVVQIPPRFRARVGLAQLFLAFAVATGALTG